MGRHCLPCHGIEGSGFRMPWGGVERCPACEKSVYPTDRVYAADRKAFHQKCIQCQVRGCRNQLTAKGIHKHEGYNFCDRCHEQLYDPRNYGPKPGSETMEEARLREAREKAERERKLREIEEMRSKQANGGGDDFSLPGCMKIAELVEINTSICL